MTIPRNPFHTLYLTEGVDEVDIPSVFSPILVPHVGPLFLPGNVVLKGMQGTGKTMLLSLLNTKVRLAFWQCDNAENGDPLHPEQRRFVGAGINLSKSNAFKLNEIIVSNDDNENTRLSRAYFADYVNCWILRDLFSSINALQTELKRKKQDERLEELGVSGESNLLRHGISSLADHVCCSFLQGAKYLEDLRRILEQRLRAYTQLISNPRKVLPSTIDETRSLLGEPLSAAVKVLRSSGVLSHDTDVIVTIDQFETLVRHERGEGDPEKHRRFLNEIDDLISNRMREVSYRIGTRPNAQLQRSEAARDYAEINLDLILQRKESDRPKRSLFQQFAEDAFRRRISISEVAFSSEILRSGAPMEITFGKSPKVADRGRLCAPKRSEKVIRFDEAWPESVSNYLADLAKRDVVSAKLGEAWVRQHFSRAKGTETLDPEAWIQAGNPPWESTEKRWWRKERLPLVSLQIAASNQQRLLYFGESDIIQLSGENIVAFICICREIWECDARYRALGSNSSDSGEFTPFTRDRQTEGIRDASRIWHDKMAQSPNGNTLQRFIDVLGKKLHQQLIGDRPMSYPGANGISLSRQDLQTDRDIERLLDDATAECYLLQRDHTPKSPSRGKSVKWYLHPILAPYFELTVAHTKEPLYVTTKKIRVWLENANVLNEKQPAVKNSKTKKPKGNASQRTLFGGDE